MSLQLSMEDVEKLEDQLYDKLVEKARVDFYTFVRLMAEVVLPEEFVTGRHIELICAELQKVEESVKDKSKSPERLQLFLPPGSMKSKLSSNLFPAWCMGRNPNWCFLAIGSDFDFAVDNFGRPTKDLLSTPQFQAIFPKTILKKDVASAGRWDTTRKGRFVARGAGQNIAGRRAHITICDDVITEQTKDIDRRKINEWYQKGLRTRLLPRGAEIIINTRWFVEDLSGYTLKLDGQRGVNEKTSRPWNVISLPALLTKEASEYLRNGLDDDEERFDIGTSFWPEFWPTQLLEEKKESMHAPEWMALYMQTPITEEGGIVKKSQFIIWDEGSPPLCRNILVSMDTAFSTKESADFSAYSVWGVFTHMVDVFEGGQIAQDCLILLAADKGRWDFAALCNKAQEINNDYSPDYFIIEDRASGQSLIQEMRKRSLPIVSYMPERDKTYRLQATTPYLQASRIYVPADRQWATDFVSEVISFNPKPTGGNTAPHDDYTDTFSQAILWMRDNFMIDNNGYTNYDDDQDTFRQKRKTYWSSLSG